MIVTAGPICERHDEPLAMHLQTIHTSASRPHQLLGVFRCPGCGFERRQPLLVEPDVQLISIEIPDSIPDRAHQSSA